MSVVLQHPQPNNSNSCTQRHWHLLDIPVFLWYSVLPGNHIPKSLLWLWITSLSLTLHLFSKNYPPSLDLHWPCTGHAHFCFSIFAHAVILHLVCLLPSLSLSQTFTNDSTEIWALFQHKIQCLSLYSVITFSNCVVCLSSPPQQSNGSPLVPSTGMSTK